ncbi:MAG: LysR family transcriptional regulator [Rhodospirillaceae bacterium]
MERFEDFDGLALFVAIADAGGLAAAERATGVPKATLSRRLAALEDRLGTRLVRRTRKGIVLTEPGEALVIQARTGLGIAVEGLRVAQGEAMALSGTCRLSLPPDLATTVLAGPLVRFQADNPGVRLDITLSDRRVSLVEEGFDLVVRAGALEDSTLRFQRLGSLPRALVVGPAFLSTHAAPLEPGDLDGLPGMGIRRDLLQWTLDGPDGRSTRVGPRPAFAANRQSILLEAARAGLGIANLPVFLIKDDLDAGRLVRVLPDWEPTPVQISALWAKDRLTERLVGAVRAEIKNALLVLAGRETGST